MFTPSELVKELNKKLDDLVQKEKDLFKDSLNAPSIDEALTLISKAEEMYAEIQKLDKRLIYLKRLEAISQSAGSKGIGLT